MSVIDNLLASRANNIYVYSNGNIIDLAARDADHPIASPHVHMPIVFGSSGSIVLDATHSFTVPAVVMSTGNEVSSFALELWFLPLSGTVNTSLLSHGGLDGLTWNGTTLSFTIRFNLASRTISYTPVAYRAMHVVAVYTARAMQLFVDGVMVGSIDITLEDIDSGMVDSGNLTVGGGSSIAVDNIALHNDYAPSENDIVSRYNLGQAPLSPVALTGLLNGRAWSLSDEERSLNPNLAQSQLITNGDASLGNNSNFSGSFTFTNSDYPAGTQGSFVANTTVAGGFLCSQIIPWDSQQAYKFAFQLRQTVAGTVSKAYGFFSPLSADNKQIAPQHYMYITNTTTTLAQPLNPGATTITLTSAANWWGSSTKPAGASSHNRSILWWDYVDGLGTAWPVGSYSQNWSGSNYWADGGINGNVITLSAPYAGPARPAGTSLSNGTSGGSYIYMPSCSNVVVPQVWTAYSDTFGPIGTMLPSLQSVAAGGAATWTTGMPPGTVSFKIGWLLNATPTSGRHAVADVSLGYLSPLQNVVYSLPSIRVRTVNWSDDPTMWSFAQMTNVNVTDKGITGQTGGVWKSALPVLSATSVKFMWNNPNVNIDISADGTSWIAIARNAKTAVPLNSGSIFVRVTFLTNGSLDDLQVTMYNKETIVKYNRIIGIGSGTTYNECHPLKYDSFGGLVNSSSNVVLGADVGSEQTLVKSLEFIMKVGTRALSGIVAGATSIYLNGELYTNQTLVDGEWAHVVYTLNATTNSEVTITPPVNIIHMGVYNTVLSADTIGELYRNYSRVPKVRTVDNIGSLQELATSYSINDFAWTTSGS